MSSMTEELQAALDKLDTFDLQLKSWTEGRPASVNGLVPVDEADLGDLLRQCREVLKRSFPLQVKPTNPGVLPFRKS